MWQVTFNKEIEVEDNDREGALQKAIKELLEDIVDINENSMYPEKDIKNLFDIEVERMSSNNLALRKGSK
jgi:hypothetical protein